MSDLGERARTDSAAPRVVSLVPSITETLLEWGVEPVAVTRFCEVPGFTTVGGTKNPDLDAIRALRPDVVLMDREENRAPDAAELSGSGICVVATGVRALDDVPAALDLIARSVGLPGSPAENSLESGAAHPVGSRRIRVFVPIWRRPWMTVGSSTYGSSLLGAAGFDNVFTSGSDPYPAVTLEEAAVRTPDRVLAPSEPYPFKERHRSELERVAEVVFVDGRDLFWWGSRTPRALGRLRRLAGDLAGA